MLKIPRIFSPLKCFSGLLFLPFSLFVSFFLAFFVLAYKHMIDQTKISISGHVWGVCAACAGVGRLGEWVGWCGGGCGHLGAGVRMCVG